MIFNFEKLLGKVKKIISGEQVVGNAKKLDGHGSDHFLPRTGGNVQNTESNTTEIALISKTGNGILRAVAMDGYCGLLNGITGNWIVQSAKDGTDIFHGMASENATNERVDNIQTSAKTTFSAAGWYRVAKYKTSGGGLIGVTGNACTLTIKKPYDTRGTEEYFLRFRAAYQSQEFAIVDAKLHGAQCITKARYTYDDEYGYIEIYFNVSASNRIFIEVTNPQDADSAWEVIEPALTEETVDGVTVTTTYDIPANAIPITTGNKPMGTYTGNGSSTERQIATGGIGRAISVIGSNGTSAIITNGAVAFGTSVTNVPKSQVGTPTSGATIFLKTTHEALNASGVEYTYQVL